MKRPSSRCKQRVLRKVIRRSPTSVELKNAGTATHSLRITGFARLRGTLNADVQARYDASIAGICDRS